MGKATAHTLRNKVTVEVHFCSSRITFPKRTLEIMFSEQKKVQINDILYCWLGIQFYVQYLYHLSDKHLYIFSHFSYLYF